MRSDLLRRYARRLRALALLCVLCLFCLFCMGPRRVARAQAEPDGYRELVQEAVDEFAAHNFEEARALFARAHARMPSARTHRGLGMVEFELRHYKESIVQLEAALRSQVKPLDGERRIETERLLDRANGFVGRVALTLEPSDAKVSIDGKPAELTTNEGVVLDLGEHSFVVEAAGHVTRQQTISVAGGDLQTLKIVLIKLLANATAEPSARSDSAPGKQRRWYKSPWLWTAVGVVVLGAAAGTSYALLRPEPETAPLYGGTSNAVIGAP